MATAAPDTSFSRAVGLRIMANSVGAFSTNLTQFNAADGSGYRFLAGIVAELDARNPQVAARLLAAFRAWRSMESGRRAMAETALREVAARRDLSADVRDIVDRSLA